jgi:hypothetical protein
MRMPILWWIGNAAWKTLYDERGNPQAAELFIAGNVTGTFPGDYG